MKNKNILLLCSVLILVCISIWGGISAHAATVAEPTPVPSEAQSKESDAASGARIYGVVTETNSWTPDSEVVYSLSSNSREVAEPTLVPDMVAISDTGSGQNVSYHYINDEEYIKVITYITKDSSTEEGLATTSDYTVKNYGCTREIYYGLGMIDTYVATVSSEYTVFIYPSSTGFPDGKVHLYTRVHSITDVNDDFTVQLSYGNIVNTDGRQSYTDGDLCFIFDENGYLGYYSLAFAITPYGVSYGNFD